jgi:hypothetical protein
LAFSSQTPSRKRREIVSMDGTTPVCLVTADDIAGLLPHAQHLTAQGCRVHILHAGKRCPTPAGITLSYLDDFPQPPHSDIATVGVNANLKRSEAIRHALTILHESQRFVRIEFGRQGACGFRSVQARRAGLALADVQLQVHTDANPARLPQCKEDLRTAFAEQYVVDHATSPVGQPTPEVLVSIVVTHYNLADYVPEALASLAGQTYPHLEVLVVDDGSTCARSRQVFDEQEQRYPRYRFLRGDNAGSGAARNRGLAVARGEFVLFFDADNVAWPEMVGVLAAALQRNPELAAMTCYARGFRDGSPPGRREWLWANAFVGGPHVLACCENVYGDTTAIFRAEELRAVGGYDTDRETPWEDWMTYLRLIHAGRRIDVVPAFLFDYRVREQGRTQLMTCGQADEDQHVQHLLKRYFSGPNLPPGVSLPELMQIVVGFTRLSDRQETWRHRAIEGLHERLRFLPWLNGGVKKLLRSIAG